MYETALFLDDIICKKRYAIKFDDLMGGENSKIGIFPFIHKNRIRNNLNFILFLFNK